jgi:hypothetical protein
MATWAWVLVALVAAPVAWWLLRVATSFLVPLEASGKAYLKQALVQRGIDPRTIPEACIDDFVAFSIKTSSFLGTVKGARLRAEVVRSLDMIAALFSLWKQNPSDSMFQEHGLGKNPYREIFERHGVRSGTAGP